jgi:hypothetical protein
MPVSFFSAKKTVWILVLGLAVLLGSLLAFPQSTAGRILGSVSDPSGAALERATVVITDLQQHIQSSRGGSGLQDRGTGKGRS